MTVSNLYVGTFTANWKWLSGRPGRGIYRFAFDDANGTLSYIDVTAGLSSPQYLAAHPWLPVLYAVEGAEPGQLAAFAVNSDGSLSAQSKVASLGAIPVGVSVHPSGWRAYVVNYWSGGLVSVVLDKDGSVLTSQVMGPESDAEPDDAAQKSARPHQIRPTPSGAGLLVVDAGRDDLVIYAADADGRPSDQPTARLDFPDKSAPRQIEFHPSGRFVYVVGESDSRLYVLAAEDGIPSHVHNSHAVVPAGYGGQNMPSELAYYPDARSAVRGEPRRQLRSDRAPRRFWGQRRGR